MPTQPKARRPSLVAQALETHEIRALRAFIYSRTSSDRHKRRTSTRDQETENRRTCADNGWIVAGAFEDPDLSASRRARKSRPDYEAMVEGIRRGECDVVVFWDSSRGNRDLVAYAHLRELCVECHVLLCYNGDVYDMSKPSDRKRSAMDAVQDEFEADRISDRAMRTKRLSAERGAPTGLIPYGYRRRYDPATGFMVGQVPDAKTAKVVREAAERVLAGAALRSICADFRARGIPPARGAKNGWQPPALRRILLNPANIGKRVHQKKVVGNAEWKSILEESVYLAVQRTLTNPARRTQRDTAVKHLLSGIAHCYCGGMLRPVCNNGKLNYVCTAAFCTGIEASRFELFVVAGVLAYLERPEFVRALESEDNSEAAAVLMADIEEMESQLAEAENLVGQRRLRPVALARIEEQLLPQLERARQGLRDIAKSPLLSGIAGPQARDAWEARDLPGRRAVLREVVRVTLNKARVRGVREIEEGRIVLEWVR